MRVSVLTLLALSGAFGQIQVLEVKSASISERTRFESAFALPSPKVGPSHVAMVAAGTLNDDSVSITAVVHRRIPAGSFIGLTVRRPFGLTYSEGILTVEQD